MKSTESIMAVFTLMFLKFSIFNADFRNAAWRLIEIPANKAALTIFYTILQANINETRKSVKIIIKNR